MAVLSHHAPFAVEHRARARVNVSRIQADADRSTIDNRGKRNRITRKRNVRMRIAVVNNPHGTQRQRVPLRIKRKPHNIVAVVAHNHASVSDGHFVFHRYHNFRHAPSPPTSKWIIFFSVLRLIRLRRNRVHHAEIPALVVAMIFRIRIHILWLLQ